MSDELVLICLYWSNLIAIQFQVVKMSTHQEMQQQAFILFYEQCPESFKVNNLYEYISMIIINLDCPVSFQMYRNNSITETKQTVSLIANRSSLIP